MTISMHSMATQLAQPESVVNQQLRAQFGLGGRDGIKQKTDLTPGMTCSRHRRRSRGSQPSTKQEIPMPFASSPTNHGRTELAAVDELPELTIRTKPFTDSRVPAGSPHRRVRATPIAVGAVVAILALTAGCSSSTTPSTTSSTPTSAAASAASSNSADDPAGKEQVCAARDDLKTSVAALTDASLLTGGTTGIRAAVAQVQTNLTAVKTAGKDTYATAVDAMQSSVDQLQTAAGELGNGNVAENLQSVGTAIAATGLAAENLFTKLKTACGS
jgi:hypothetical protein